MITFILNKIVSEFAIVLVQFNSTAQTQGSKLTVPNPTEDKIYTCKVHYGGEEIKSNNVQLNVYGKLSPD